MNYCANCIRYDYCSARGMCISPPFGYCTQYQPKSWCVVMIDEVEDETERCGAKMDEVTDEID